MIGRTARACELSTGVAPHPTALEMRRPRRAMRDTACSRPANRSKCVGAQPWGFWLAQQDFFSAAFISGQAAFVSEQELFSVLHSAFGAVGAAGSETDCLSVVLQATMQPTSAAARRRLFMNRFLCVSVAAHGPRIDV
jgi:hypothetical protein